MNERIEQLYEQAHGRKPTMVIDHETGQAVHATFRGEPMYTKDFDPKKFAEFIIQDILTVVKSEHKLALEFQWDADDTAIAIRDAIKKRFGVAE